MIKSFEDKIVHLSRRQKKKKNLYLQAMEALRHLWQLDSAAAVFGGIDDSIY